MKFLTIEDLYNFCKTNNFQNFNSKDFNGKSIIVQSIETFEVSNKAKDGLLPVKLKACHIGKNLNTSSINKEVMEANKNSFKGRPILGAIYKTDTGEFEFRGHDMTINNDGEVEYIEQPIGVISEIEDPYLEYDKEQDKTYLMVSGNIFEDYSHASEILQRRRTCKCSVELAVDEFSWDCDEECLSIDNFTFRGVTILGTLQDGITEVQEGMKGSKITIDDFSSKNNSMFSTDTKLIETLEKLNDTLSSFNNINFNTKGVESSMNHFEELLEEYGVTIEDIDFEYENLSDEELDAKFEECFKCKKKCEADESGEDSGDETDPESTSEDPEVSDTPAPAEPSGESEKPEVSDDDKSKKNKYSLDDNGNMSVTYQISHDDIRNGLYNLLFAEEGTGWPWIIDVYDDHFIYADDKYYKRKYTRDGDNIALAESKVEVFSEWLTAEERNALDTLKSDYAALKEFKSNYDKETERTEKETVLNSAEYSAIRELDEFKELCANMDKYSLDEVKTKADLIFAAMAKKQFSTENVEKNHSIGININKKKTKSNSPYGGLFDDEE